MNAPTIETPRLYLRPWRDSDVDPWAAMSADPRVMEFYPEVYDRARSEESASKMRAWLEQDGYGLWAVEIKETARFAGIIGVQDIPYAVPFTPPREVGWRLAYDHWGKGYATEGALAAIDFAFTKLDWDELIAMTSRLNLRSQGVMQRLGMAHNPADDFDHPRLPQAHRLRPHVVYRLHRPARTQG